MNAARAAALALIACAGVATPATTAHADDPLLCGLLAPCDGESGGVDGGGESEPAPVDDGADIDVDLGLGLGTDVEIQLFPNSGTLLTADTDVDHATLELAAADHVLDLVGEAVLDTDASVARDGIVVTGDGSANAQMEATTWRKLVGLEAANRFCGVQVVIAAESSATCQPNAAPGPAASEQGLIAVAESVDLCGAHVVLAGSATTGCGDSSPTGSPEAGSSWTLADAVEGAGSSPAAGGQSAETPNDEGNSGTTAGESRGSLPLTGTSVLLFLTLAAAVVAAGLVAVRSTPVRVGHQS